MVWVVGLNPRSDQNWSHGATRLRARAEHQECRSVSCRAGLRRVATRIVAGFYGFHELKLSKRKLLPQIGRRDDLGYPVRISRG